jgi:pilus assembly protein CpaB
LLEKFGTAGSTQALPLPDGTIAVSVQLSDPARVAGFVAPGSHVAVFATVDQPSTATPTPRATANQAATTGASDAKLTAVLLPKAEVIAVGATTVVPVKTTTSSGNEQTEPIPKTILTLALAPGDAQKLVYASQQGELYFGLTTDKSGVTKAPGTTLDNLFK